MSTTDLDPAAADLGGGDAAALLDCQSRVLGLITTSASRRALLDEIVLGVERLVPSSRCSVMLLDAAGTLRYAASMSLPASYLAATDGVAPGERQGSCGTAAYLAQPVIADDIWSDYRWDGYHELAASAGLRSCWSTPVFGRTGRVAGTLAVYHDRCFRPTARQQHLVSQVSHLVSVVLEHAAMIGDLTVSEERFRRAFEDNATAMGLLDNRGVFSRVNTALHVLTGHRLVPGMSKLADTVVPENAADVSALLNEVCAGRLRQAQCEARVADGRSERVVSMTMSLVRAADGEAHQVSVSMQDLTPRLVAKQERRARLDAELAQRGAEAASHAKSAFLAAVSHEMRTPLQAITGFAELLGTLELDADRRAEALRHISTGAAHVLELVDDTLDLSRIEAHALPLSPREMATQAVVADVLDFLAPVAARHDVRLAAGSCAGVVLADERRLRQVLINLVTNGVRYSGAGSMVSVGATDEGGTVRITVADDGPGIPADLRTRLFQPFLQTVTDGSDTATNSTAANGHGAGLGLMLASGLTEAMGGRLTLADPATGTGTVATITLPAADAAERDQRAAKPGSGGR